MAEPTSDQILQVCELTQVDELSARVLLRVRKARQARRRTQLRLIWQKSNNDVNTAVNAFYEDPVGSVKDAVSTVLYHPVRAPLKSASFLRMSGSIRTTFHVRRRRSIPRAPERLILTRAFHIVADDSSAGGMPAVGRPPSRVDNTRPLLDLSGEHAKGVCQAWSRLFSLLLTVQQPPKTPCTP